MPSHPTKYAAPLLLLYHNPSWVLHYSPDQLDAGPNKTTTQSHFRLLDPVAETHLDIDGYSAGVACINSWGALPLPEYRLPYSDYTFGFTFRPVGR